MVAAGRRTDATASSADSRASPPAQILGLFIEHPAMCPSCRPDAAQSGTYVGVGKVGKNRTTRLMFSVSFLARRHSVSAPLSTNSLHDVKLITPQTN